MSLDSFAADVDKGLSAKAKYLPSKYFYDAAGDRLFQQIMKLPEYYLTRAENQILKDHAPEIIAALNGPIQMVELGVGDGTKTIHLLEHALSSSLQFEYVPIDISPNILGETTAHFSSLFPALPIKALTGDYFQMMGELTTSGRRKLVLFLGANIGNYSFDQAVAFLRLLRSKLKVGDNLLIGIDLMKDPRKILNAYNDSERITEAFNFNLLHRINRDLDGNIEVDAFQHWPYYNPSSGETRSFLVSTKDQLIRLGYSGKTYSISAWEAISVELSLKYSMEGINELAKASGWQIRRHFTDQNRYFVDSLWEVVR